MATLSIGDCVRYGWETFKKRPWLLIGAPLLAMVIGAIPNMLQTPPEYGPDGELIAQPLTAYDAILAIAGLVLSVFVSLALTSFSLRAHDNLEAARVDDLWNPRPFWSFLGVWILSFIVVVLGLVAFVIPGIILGLGFSLAPYLVVDRGLGPIGAMGESWRITKGHKWRLFLLFLVLLGINILGLLALVLGVLVAIPVSLLAMAHAYRTLSSPGLGAAGT